MALSLLASSAIIPPGSPRCYNYKCRAHWLSDIFHSSHWCDWVSNFFRSHVEIAVTLGTLLHSHMGACVQNLSHVWHSLAVKLRLEQNFANMHQPKLAKIVPVDVSQQRTRLHSKSKNSEHTHALPKTKPPKAEVSLNPQPKRNTCSRKKASWCKTASRFSLHFLSTVQCVFLAGCLGFPCVSFQISCDLSSNIPWMSLCFPYSLACLNFSLGSTRVSGFWWDHCVSSPTGFFRWSFDGLLFFCHI